MKTKIVRASDLGDDWRAESHVTRNTKARRRPPKPIEARELGYRAMKRRGKNKSTYREWLSRDKRYVIIWRREAWGVRVKPGYRAMRIVGTLRLSLGFPHAGPKLYTTFAAAAKAIERGR